MRKQINMRRILATLVLSVLISAALPVVVHGQINCSENTCFTPTITIPGTEIEAGKAILIDGNTIGRYILALYKFGVYAGGIVATLVIMAAGVVWLLAGGNTGQADQARGMIKGAIAGYALLLLSWVLLNTINPNLTRFTPLDIAVTPYIPIEEQVSTCCACTQRSTPPTTQCSTFVSTTSSTEGVCVCDGNSNAGFSVENEEGCKSYGSTCVFSGVNSSSDATPDKCRLQMGLPSTYDCQIVSGGCGKVAQCQLSLTTGCSGDSDCKDGRRCNFAYRVEAGFIEDVITAVGQNSRGACVFPGAEGANCRVDDDCISKDCGWTITLNPFNGECN